MLSIYYRIHRFVRFSRVLIIAMCAIGSILKQRAYKTGQRETKKRFIYDRSRCSSREEVAAKETAGVAAAGIVKSNQESHASERPVSLSERVF